MGRILKRLSWGAAFATLLASSVIALLPVQSARAARPSQSLPQAEIKPREMVLSQAEVELRKLGLLPGTKLIYVEFTDGSRCLASNDGSGDISCDWSK